MRSPCSSTGVKARRCGSAAETASTGRRARSSSASARRPSSSSPSAVKRSGSPASRASCDRRDGAAARGLLPRLRRVHDLAGRGTRSTRANSTHSTWPTTATRIAQLSQLEPRARFTDDDGGREPSAVRALLRRAPRRGLRVPRAAGSAASGRGRVPGDVPARAARVRRASSTASTCAPGSSRSPRGSSIDEQPAAAPATHELPELPSSTDGPRTPSSSTSRGSAADRARGGRAPLRLRPRLRRHRGRARLDARRRRARPPRRASGACAGRSSHDRFDRARPALPRRRGDAGAPRRRLRPRRLAGRAAARRRHRARPLPHLVRPRARASTLDALARAFGAARAARRRGRSTTCAAQLDEYFEGRRQGFELDARPHAAPPFPQRVLDELARVPYGETTTYGALAAQVGAPGPPAPSAWCMNRNPIPIVLPCHRVVGAERKPRRLRRRARRQGAAAAPRGRPAVDGTQLGYAARHGGSDDRRLRLRRGALRGGGTARLGVVLPLHPLPAEERHGSVRERAGGAGQRPHHRRRGGGARVGARGRPREALLRTLRLGALRPRPRRRRSAASASAAIDGDPGRPATVAPVRRVRGGLGGAARRRPAEVPRSASVLGLAPTALVSVVLVVR